MPRTVVPPATRRDKAAAPAEGGRENGGDKLPEKLVKYVPAETLAFFVPFAAAVGTKRNGLLVVALVVGLVGGLGYLWLAAQKLQAAERPTLHFYVLAGLAFLAWAVGTTPSVSNLFGLDEVAAGLVLLAAVFVIPVADGLLNQLRRG